MNTEQREQWRKHLHTLIDEVFDEAVILEVDRDSEHTSGPFGPQPTGRHTVTIRWANMPPARSELLNATQHGPVPMNPFGDDPGPYDPDWDAQDEGPL